MTTARDPVTAAAPGGAGNGAFAPTSAPPPAPPKRKGIFFGWYIVAGGFVLNAILGGLMFHAFGLYVVEFVEEFGWSRTALSIAFSIQMVEAGLLGPIQGFVLDKYGPRRIMLVGITIFGIGFFMLSQINTLTEFYIAFIVIALGMGVGSMMGVAVAVVNWFNRKRALATAIMTIGFAFGGFLQPGVAWALENIGWRETSFISGLLVLGVGLPLALLMRHRPEQYGYGVDGDPPRQGLGATGSMEDFDPDEINFTWQEAMRTRAFWLISVGHALSLLVIGAVMVHFVSYISDSLGYSLSQAANLLLVITVATVIGMLVGGYLGDRMPMRHILAVAMIGHMVSLLVLTLWATIEGAITFSIIHGLAFGARGPLTMAIRAEYFGRAAFGTVMGFSSLIILLGMVFGPIIAGLSYDITGSYQTGFIGLALVGGLGSIAFVFSTRPAPPPSWLARQAASRVAGAGPSAAAAPVSVAPASAPVPAIEASAPETVPESVVAAAPAAPIEVRARRSRTSWVLWVVATVLLGSAITAGFVLGAAALVAEGLVAVNGFFLSLIDSYGALPILLIGAAAALVLVASWVVLMKVRRRRKEDRAWSAPVIVIATGAAAAERAAATETAEAVATSDAASTVAPAEPVEAAPPVGDTEPVEVVAAIEATEPTEDMETADEAEAEPAAPVETPEPIAATNDVEPATPVPAPIVATNDVEPVAAMDLPAPTAAADEAAEPENAAEIPEAVVAINGPEPGEPIAVAEPVNGDGTAEAGAPRRRPIATLSHEGLN